MGAFWNYFKEGLAWPLARTPGPLALLLEGGAEALDAAIERIRWLRDQYCPARCEGWALGLFGTSRSLTKHPAESEGRWRARVVHAWAWHVLAGRQGGMPKLLAHYGFPGAAIVNCRTADPERWAEFWCDLLPPLQGLWSGFSPTDFEALLFLLNDVKPARSKLTSIRWNVRDTVALEASVVVLQGERMGVPVRIALPVPDAWRMAVGAAVTQADTQTVPVAMPRVPAPAWPVYTGCVVAVSETLSIPVRRVVRQ